MPKTDLLKTWANWKADEPPFVLDGDREVFDSPRSKEAITIHRSWQEAIRSPNFAAPGDTRLHHGLLPIPFLGNVRRATIYILLLNPGLGPHDYFGEYEVPKYRAALLANLKQKFKPGSIPFLALDPQFVWHGGFDWWHGKLSKVIEELAAAKGISFAKARSRLGSKLACIELLPYHSVSFRDRVFSASQVGTVSSLKLMDTLGYNYPTRGVYHDQEQRF